MTRSAEFTFSVELSSASSRSAPQRSASMQRSAAPVDDPELDRQMALLADGDRSAIEPLFRALWPVVHAYCQRALGHGADADDAAQQTMEKVFAEATRYDKERRALPWVVTIALWECRTIRRRVQRTRTVSLDGTADTSSSDRTPEESAIDRDLLDGAWAAFEHLSPADREVLRQTFEDDASSTLAVSGATLRQRRERAMHRVREAWRKLYGR